MASAGKRKNNTKRQKDFERLYPKNLETSTQAWADGYGVSKTVIHKWIKDYNLKKSRSVKNGE